jgi:xylulokinase
MPAQQILKVREGDSDGWAVTERVMLASAFLATLLLGKWAPMSESEIVATGLWDHPKGWWDESMLDLLCGTKEGTKQLMKMLGEVERSGAKHLGTVAPYFVDRYGLSRGLCLSTSQ